MAPFSFRTLAERIVRNRSFWRHLPVEFGRAPLRITPDTALQVLKPGPAAFDPMLLRFCDEYVKNDSVVWDIGANIGIFSLAAASRGGNVIAIEPDPWLCSLLRKTQDHPKNQKLLFEPLCAAIASECGTARLSIAQRGRSANFLEKFGGSTQTGGTRATHLVPILTLDTLMLDGPTPTILKIDVERAELAVLQGAKLILEKARPTILIEVAIETRTEVITLLKDANYHLADYQADPGTVVNIDQSENLLAIPQ